VVATVGRDELAAENTAGAGRFGARLDGSSWIGTRYTLASSARYLQVAIAALAGGSLR